MKVCVSANDFNRMLKTAGKYIDRYGILAGELALSVHDGRFEVIVVALDGNYQTTELHQWVDAGYVYNEDFERVPAEDGFCVVRAKDFAPLKSVKKGSEILIDAQKSIISVTTDDFTFELNEARDPTEFPPPLLPEDKDNPAEALEIVPADCECFGYIIPALSTDESRPDFLGAVLRDGVLVAVDGHRMHHCPLPALFGTGTLTGIIAPQLLRFIADGHSGTLREYTGTRTREEKNLNGETVSVTETVATWHILEGSSFIFKSRPIAGLFPDFAKVIPHYQSYETAEIDAETLARAIKPLCAGWKINLTCTMFDVPDGIKLKCTGSPGPKSSAQPPRVSVLKDIKLPNLPVCLNPTYIMDALAGFSGTIAFCCIDRDSPVWIGEWQSNGPGRGAVIMPMDF